MKAKSIKKLFLKKVTLANLGDYEMRLVKGGLTPTITSCPARCQPTNPWLSIPCITAIPEFCGGTDECTQPCW
jgi:natural product precursor